jgi:diguanylate cyclase (GGDEF)-like protein
MDPGTQRLVTQALLLVGLATALALVWPAAAPLQAWLDGGPWRPSAGLLVGPGLALAAVPLVAAGRGRSAERDGPALVAAVLGLLAALRLVPLDALALAAGSLLHAARPQGPSGEPGRPPPVDELPDAILVVADDGTITYANPAARRLLGAPLLGRTAGRYLPDLKDPARAAELALGGAAVELEAVHESSRALAVEARVATLHGGHAVRLLDAATRSRERAQMEQLAWHDPLTGLPNRRLLQDRAGQALLQAERHRQPLGLMLLDLDRFKEVNDTLGHQVGDLLLQQVAERLGRPLRRSDTLARLGGDEFAVLLGPPTGLETACRVAERLVEQLVAPFTVDGSRLEVGVSIGVALFPDHGADLATLLQQADAAMYKAKRERLGFVVCNVEQPDSTRRRLEMRRDVKEALAADRLQLLYQPKVAADSRALVGVEALLRWPHPELGLLDPGEFLPVVEQTGLVPQLAFWTLNACLREQRRWRLAGLDLPVAVNLAPACLKLPELPQLLRLALAHWETRADRLVLEVPESAVMADVEAALPQLAAVAATGCEVALDEFGCGRSSLVHLPRLAVAELKIPRLLVQAMEAEPQSRIVARSIVRLAHGLGRRVVATGVESETNAARLAAMRCDQLQGFLFGRPMPAEEVPDRLRALGPTAGWTDS